MSVIAPAGDRIRKLRAIGNTRDPLAVRLALERSLNEGHLHPRSLPRDAIICVRRLRVSAAHFRSNKWEEAADRQMKVMLADVSRPYRETVPANSPIVAFADTAELLACLARDWLNGEGDSWWWRSIVGAPLNHTVVQQALSEKPTVIPVTIELLAKAGLAARFVNSMTDEWCRDVCTTVASQFAVPDLESPANRLRSSRADRTTAARDSVVDLLARVHAVVGPVDGYDDLSDGRRMLLGVALLLHRAPAIARRAGIGAVLLSRSRSVTPSELSVGDDTGLSHDQRHRIGNRATKSIATTESSPGNTPLGTKLNDFPTAVVPDQNTGEVEWDRASSTIAQSGSASELTDNAGPSPQGPNEIDKDHGRVISVDTSFAGVLYLLNVALHLGLYGDFTQPQRPGLSLPLGDFLALIGRRVCGAALERDPLWGLLAAMSRWDPAAGTGEYEPERTCTADDAQLFAAVTGATDRSDDWVEHLISALESRVATALRIADRDALAFLCARHGRVSLSDSRLEAVFQLAAHPLAIRLAGLDRNPGWVPAAGRVVEFRYE